MSGSQISNSKNNQIILGSITDIKYKNIDEKLSSSSSSSSDEGSESDDSVQPQLKVVCFPHQGGVNKIAVIEFVDWLTSYSDVDVDLF